MKTLALILLCGMSFGQELRRPTADAGAVASAWINTNCGIGTLLSSSAAPLAYDAAGQSTSSSISASSTPSAKRVAARIFSTWQTTSNTYTGLTLNVAANLGGTFGGGAVVYSIDSGTTWTSLGALGPTLATTTVSLSASLDLSKLRVGVCAVGFPDGDGGSGFGLVNVYDIWTSGTSGSPAAGSGSGSGTAVQPVQFN